ncbi:MAG: class A beta-lactamase-related serine hydrolase [Actinomycetia bacterium]|nr:class A beta-lactamase-related serine hydrolase [Actinomycetes bacterium]
MNSPAAAVNLPADVRWSVRVVHSASRTPLIEVEAERECATASIGKILLLISISERIESGELSPDTLLDRADLYPVAESGLWQHLDVDRLSVADLCSLVGATSDNLATNVLITLAGLDSVAATGRRLGMTKTALHDIVRDHRLPEHPPALSSGSAKDLVHLCRLLDDADQVSPAVSGQVTKWLSTNTDLSMVASAFGLDPLAHGDTDRGIRLWNKTGTNDGVRCDVGVAHFGGESVTYAVLANWTPPEPNDTTRDDVLAAMRAIGVLIKDSLTNPPT